MSFHVSDGSDATIDGTSDKEVFLLKYVFLGGAGEVGASCLLVSVADRNILIDAGIRVNASGEAALPDFKTLREMTSTLDAIFISHAHADHVGALPLVHKLFPQTPIYTTLPTQRLSAVMLSDSVRVQEFGAEKLFNQEAVDTVLWKMETVEMGIWHPLWDDFRYQFHASGHVLGAVSILLETPEGKLLYSGDVSAFNQNTIDGIKDISFFKPDLMWCEATYGASNHPSRSEEEKRLATSVAEVIEGGGSVLIPSFALGRAQEIILILKKMQEAKTIPKFPVITDGLVNVICSIYESLPPHLGTKLHNYVLNSRQPIFHTASVRKAKPGEREKLLNDGRPKCIIASSGMLTGGASVFYATGLAGNEKNAIFLSGYQDAESPGRRLQELKSGDELQLADKTVEVKCRIDRFGLSAHSDQQQLMNMIRQAAPKALALVHAEPEVAEALRERIYKDYIMYSPINGQVEDGTQRPLWQPPEKKVKPETPSPLDFDIAFGEANTLHIPDEIADVDRWKAFIEGEHTARLKGNALIIRKREP